MQAAQIEPPEHLSEAAKGKWREICEQNSIDTAAALILRTFCEAYDRREEARAMIAKEGAVYLDRFKCPKISPWVAIERDSTLVMHRAFRLLGFDQEPRGGSDPQASLFVN